MTIDNIRNANDLDQPWPVQLLLDAIGFRSRVRGRVEDYLERNNIPSLSLRDLMAIFLPAAIEPPFDEVAQFWASIPILRQPQFGPYLYDSALLTITAADTSQEFKTEWAMRICQMVLYDLREKPANKWLQRAAKNAAAAEPKRSVERITMKMDYEDIPKADQFLAERRI